MKNEKKLKFEFLALLFCFILKWFRKLNNFTRKKNGWYAKQKKLSSSFIQSFFRTATNSFEFDCFVIVTKRKSQSDVVFVCVSFIVCCSLADFLFNG